MNVTLLYFARLREQFGTASEAATLPAEVKTLGDLVAWLRARGGHWATELAEGRAFRLAVNQDMADPATALKDGDEVAIFPPVTGG
ncbi:molybdopterin synthase subunit MoaD [Sulfuritortus calidifontis]|uniref:Molybdopterin synthase sulfur carrier subunit n=1 Tax=Sulfuritortus calidifontis TaxID=1914471 RepID=A0A4R3JZ17_9PROT|nr:molybdopterin converting factor subunit 1 [Sulfuritortus calidifontis]TCS74038.1 molybdopterin synthase subunit MoaD [Sulfuritortus calidifontis]